MAQMKRVFVSYLQGAGSILEIVVPSTYWHLVPRESFNMRLEADFHRVGGAIRHGMDIWNKEKTQGREQEQASLRTAG